MNLVTSLSYSQDQWSNGDTTQRHKYSGNPLQTSSHYDGRHLSTLFVFGLTLITTSFILRGVFHFPPRKMDQKNQSNSTNNARHQSPFPNNKSVSLSLAPKRAILSSRLAHAAWKEPISWPRLWHFRNDKFVSIWSCLRVIPLRSWSWRLLVPIGSKLIYFKLVKYVRYWDGLI